MITLYFPYLIGLGLGIAPPVALLPATPPDAFVQENTTPAVPDVTLPGAALAAEFAGRTPEAQTGTGRFTTAAEVKQILLMTKGNWVAINAGDGQDILYFTHLLAWRCGLWAIRYGLNGQAATTDLPLEPCHEDTTTPNAMTDVANYLPYVVLPEGSIGSVYIEILFDDGTTDFATFPRAAIMLP